MPEPTLRLTAAGQGDSPAGDVPTLQDLLAELRTLVGMVRQGDAALLTPRDAARMLAISERSLWALTDAGEVPCCRIGRSVRYSRADLLAFVERLRAESK